MKLKVKINGPKVHDVGYRYFLLGIAMSNRIRKFEAHNTKSSDGAAVQVFADGDDAAIKAFRAQVETERPAGSRVSNIIFEDFEGDVMKIGEYAQFCATIQLNKAIPVLLEIRDNTKKSLDEIKEEIKGLREDTQPEYARQMQADIQEIKAYLGMH